MNHFQRRLRCMVVLCLLTAPVLANDIDAGALVEQLNRRYASTPEGCPGGKPLAACSGVLARPMPDSKSTPFWKLTTDAGAQVFTYLRADQPENRPAGRAGFILMNATKARLQKKEYSYREGQYELTREVRVASWDEARPETLAVEAFYYAGATPLDLYRAQRGQWTWYTQTGNWLPVLRYWPDKAPAVFEYDPDEQLYHGPDVAAAVMKRYNDRAARCPGDAPALLCNGVLIRTTTNEHFDPWNPNPYSSAGGVSASVARDGLRVNKTMYSQGYILFPLGKLLNVRCVFPADGYTGNQQDRCSFRPACNAMDVDTWFSKYGKDVRQSCYYAPDAAGVERANAIRESGRPLLQGYGWNEVILTTWPQNKGKELSMQAFFYSTNFYHPEGGEPPGTGLAGAQTFQRKLLERDSRYLPVLKMSPDAWGGASFTYDFVDQPLE